MTRKGHEVFRVDAAISLANAVASTLSPSRRSMALLRFDSAPLLNRPPTSSTAAPLRRKLYLTCALNADIAKTALVPTRKRGTFRFHPLGDRRFDAVDRLAKLGEKCALPRRKPGQVGIDGHRRLRHAIAPLPGRSLGPVT